MPSLKLLDPLEDSDPFELFDSGGHLKRRKWSHKPKIQGAQLANELRLLAENSRAGFQPTFTSSRHEHEWIVNYLGAFYEDSLITDVLRQVKGGKEATVYCCSAHPRTGAEWVAAKVYRPRVFRALKNDAPYRQGRRVLDADGKLVKNDSMLGAVQKGTSFGKELLHTSWLAHEYQTLVLLHRAGADVPQPLASNDNAILMEYVGEAELAAPALHEVRLPADEVRPLFDRLIANVETMLACHRVHADLSAYNVLYWEGEIRIIDFPQSVDPRENRHARRFFWRDVERLCQYFARYGLRTDAAALAGSIWARHVQPGEDAALLAAAIG